MPETVLVVDDHSLVLTTLVSTLLHAGFQVLSASSGGEALAVASRPGQRIDLLVCDLILPDMPGTDLARKVSEVHPYMRYLYITGLPDHPRVTEDIVAALLPKPFLPHVLVSRARAALGTHPRTMTATAVG
jgi:DNA-binding response OmpR family regulator